MAPIGAAAKAPGGGRAIGEVKAPARAGEATQVGVQLPTKVTAFMPMSIKAPAGNNKLPFNGIM